MKEDTSMDYRTDDDVTEESAALESESGLNPDDEDDSLEIYPNAEVRISRSQYSLLHVKTLYEKRKELVIDPEFQRNSVWTSRQRSELIESVLMGIPLPVIYLFESRDGKKQVVDGRQRITAIIDFLNDGFKLSDLKILHDLNGKSFTQLDPKMQGIAEDYQILAYVIQPPTPERVKYDIFDRVNRGGTTLNSQEMRNALYGGNCVKLIKKVCESDTFIRATDHGVSSKRMRDRYVVLRAMAYTDFYNGGILGDKERVIEYRNGIDDFLARYMMAVNRQLKDDADVDAVAERVLGVFGEIYRVLGPDAFRFSNSNGKRRPINMPLVETLYYFFQLPRPAVDDDTLREAIRQWKVELDATNYFRRSIDSSTSVAGRRNEVMKFIATLNR